MSNNVVDLRRRFAYFLELEIEVWQFVERKAQDSKQAFTVGTFSSLAERNVWKRAFWANLPTTVRPYCQIRQITSPLLQSRRRKVDIRIKNFDGDPETVAKRILRLAREKLSSERSS